MIVLLLILAAAVIYFLACTPCRQHVADKLKKLFSAIKKFRSNPKCLLALALAILGTIIVVYNVSTNKEMGFFRTETKCENSVKNEFGVFFKSGNCRCDTCSKKALTTTPKTPHNADKISPSN